MGDWAGELARAARGGVAPKPALHLVTFCAEPRLRAEGTAC